MLNCTLKGIFLFIVIFITMFSVSQAQPYLNETARWKQSFNYNGMTNSTQCISNRYFNGDTLIAGKNYYLLFYSDRCIRTTRTFDSLGNPIITYDTTDVTSFLGYIREENKKIYFRDINDTEVIKYNFNAKENAIIDSMVHTPGCGFPSSAYILTADSVCLGNNIRKRWKVSMSLYPLANYIIEGIGPSSGFLSPVCRNGCPECGYQLLSFTMNGDTLYKGNCMATGIQLDEEEKFSIYPNPTTSSIIVEASSSIEQIEVFNVLGKKMGEVLPNASKYELTELLPSEGIYLLRIKINGTFSVYRILKN